METSKCHYAIAMMVKTLGLSPVKTRLAKGLGQQVAEEFYTQSVRTLLQTLKSCKQAGIAEPYVAYAEESAKDSWQELPNLWQGDGELGHRMKHIFEELLKKHRGVLLIGSDLPQLSVAEIKSAVEVLESKDHCIGPSEDGGFYLFGGVRAVKDAVWLTTPYSDPRTFEVFRKGVEEDSTLAILPVRYDIDTEQDLSHFFRDLTTFEKDVPDLSNFRNQHFSRFFANGILATAFLFLGFFAPLFQNALASEPPGGSGLQLTEQWKKHWFDGLAEISTYDIEIERYKETRKGTAAAIFVTETLSLSKRVKSDPGKNPPADEVPVMKLNFVLDFPTGVYDYNVMQSSFSSLSDTQIGPAGTLLKSSFSSQEWCGHVFQQFTAHKNEIELDSHSYFDGEGDRKMTFPTQSNDHFGDGLFLWARGFALPVSQSGNTPGGRLFSSALDARFLHFTPFFQSAKFDGELGADEKRTVRLADGQIYNFAVEKQFPYLLKSWSIEGGKGVKFSGKRIKTARLPYWQLNGLKGIEKLKELGLSPRPQRTP